MTMKSMANWFFMRNGFTTFNVVPESDGHLLFGERDREQRDELLEGLEEGCYSLEGHKAVVYGDYGRGKTHQARNLIHEVTRRDLPLVPIYMKCTEYKAKEPFSTLFGQLMQSLNLKDVQDATTDYLRAVNNGKAEPIESVVEHREVAEGIRALANPNADTVSLALKWLGGGQKLDTARIASGLSPALTVSRDFGAVMKGLSEIFRTARKKALVVFLDEAERLNQISHTDTYWSWAASLRELTELNSVGYVFFVGAKTRDQIPEMLTLDEIATRIGISNYRDLLNPGPEVLRQWVGEFFQTYVRKGAVPAPLKPALGEAAEDESIPAELNDLTNGEADRLDAYPLTPTALEKLIEESARDELSNKPREVTKKIQRAAQKAMRLDQRVIDDGILDRIRGDGF